MGSMQLRVRSSRNDDGSKAGCKRRAEERSERKRMTEFAPSCKSGQARSYSEFCESQVSIPGGKEKKP